MTLARSHRSVLAVLAVSALAVASCGGSSASGNDDAVNLTASVNGYSFNAIDGGAVSFDCGTPLLPCLLDLAFDDFINVCNGPPEQGEDWVTVDINARGQQLEPGTFPATAASLEYVRLSAPEAATQVTNLAGSITITSVSRGSPNQFQAFPTSVAGTIDVTFDQGWLKGSFSLDPECQ